MAAWVNGWLIKVGLAPLTSTSPREGLDGRLRELVKTGKMIVQEYETLLDHKWETAVSHYSNGEVMTKRNRKE